MLWLYYSFILQNENVRRESTSERLVQDARRPDRRTPVRVLVEKTFEFVEDVWESFVQQRSVDLRYTAKYLCSNLDTVYMIDLIILLVHCMCSDYVEPEQSDEPVDENEDIMNDGVHVLDKDLDEDI